MALKVQTRFPGANAKVLRSTSTEQEASVEFTAHPQGGPVPLWFCLRLVVDGPGEPHPDRVTLRLRFFETLRGDADPEAMRPVYQPQGKNWFRCNAAHPVRRDDGSVDVEWCIPYPETETLFALCYPYQREDLQRVLQRCRGFWSSDSIGLSSEGRALERVANDYGTAQGKRPGIYLVARRRAGATPGSWVLDGLMDRLSREKKQPFVAWAIPFADVDGTVRGAEGSEGLIPGGCEAGLIRQDILRWSQRCRPALVLDLQAPGGCAREGVFARMPPADTDQDAQQAAQSWANSFATALGSAYAAEDFGRAATAAEDWLGELTRGEIGIPAIRLEIPYTFCGSTAMTHKAYRDIGRLLAKAILERLRNQG